MKITKQTDTVLTLENNVPLLVFVGTEEPILRQPGTPPKEKDAFYDI